MKRQSRRIVVWLLLVTPVLLALAYLVFLDCEAERMSPSQAAHTYRGFVAEMPTPQSLVRFDVKGEQYLLVTGPLPALLALPSGPPQYVFDGNGQLVDWTSDSGDDPGFVANWSTSWSGAPVTPTEAIRVFGK